MPELLCQIKDKDKEQDSEGTFKTESSKNPKEITINFDKGPEKGFRKGTGLYAIYLLEGDSLKICFFIFRLKKRSSVPTTFEGSINQILLILKRQKP